MKTKLHNIKIAYLLLFFIILTLSCNKETNNTKYKTLGTVIDIDGNIYEYNQIGQQIWMMQNLKVTHYRNGIAIPKVTNNTEWSTLTTGAYSDYNNSISNSTTYGRLYNWYTIVDTSKLCPAGWHVPTDAEWTTLKNYLGLSTGGKLKETGTNHWWPPNSGATNETNFTALPGGIRLSNGTFRDMLYYGYWWSSTEDGTSKAWERFMHSSTGLIYSYNDNKQYGFSVRCIKD